jgi:hypothetical protein
MTNEQKQMFAAMAHIRAARTELDVTANSTRADRAPFGTLCMCVSILDLLIDKLDLELTYIDWVETEVKSD